MVSGMEGPRNILGMDRRLFGLFFIMFLLLLANFSGIHLVSWQDGKPGEGGWGCSPALRDGPTCVSSWPRCRMQRGWRIPR